MIRLERIGDNNKIEKVNFIIDTNSVYKFWKKQKQKIIGKERY